MNYDKFTEKSREALAGAQQLAATMNHQELVGLHLLASLLHDSEGLVGALLGKLGQERTRVEQEVMRGLSRLPQVTGDGATQVYMGREGMQVLQAAEDEAGKLRDEFISVEHLFLGILEKSKAAGEILSRLGITRERVFNAMKEVRGNQRVTSATPEASFQ
ncbi:MAG TPA: Clp protease N-terminal domain-containing protein, partial [Lentisphaeria bacterium]|nr:Clp protease N-terminal domain-containing protein [Lentisphaeria bacterium]